MEDKLSLDLIYFYFEPQTIDSKPQITSSDTVIYIIIAQTYGCFTINNG
jgi:hypothetical protein